MTKQSQQHSVVSLSLTENTPLLVNAFTAATGELLPANSKKTGNPCLLSLFNAEPDFTPAQAVATQCHSWQTLNAIGNAINLKCFNAQGELIQCCGHGLLTAAFCWQQHLQRDQIQLTMNGSTIESWRENNITWLRFTRLQTTHCDVPKWIKEVFNDQPLPILAALAGDDQGYIIFQWPDGFNLKTLNANGNRISALTQRAVICTAAQPSSATGNIQLRYFAPQYGNAEDTATGSALRVLADYWSPRFSQLNAQQCSPAGGHLLSRFFKHCIEIGGYCIIKTSKNNSEHANHE
jgi:predicted PhzF superfamily epimerase YddE/YHI9